MKFFALPITLLVLLIAAAIVAVIKISDPIPNTPPKQVQVEVTFQGQSPLTCTLETFDVTRIPGTCFIESRSGVMRVFTTQGEQAGTQWHFTTIPRR